MGQQERNEILPLLCLCLNHRSSFYKLMQISHTQTYMAEFDKEISLWANIHNMGAFFFSGLKILACYFDMRSG